LVLFYTNTFNGRPILGTKILELLKENIGYTRFVFTSRKWPNNWEVVYNETKAFLAVCLYEAQRLGYRAH